MPSPAFVFVPTFAVAENREASQLVTRDTLIVSQDAHRQLRSRPTGLRLHRRQHSRPSITRK